MCPAAARPMRTTMRILPIVIFVVRMSARPVTAGRAVVLVTAVFVTPRAVLTGVAATIGRWLRWQRRRWRWRQRWRQASIRWRRWRDEWWWWWRRRRLSIRPILMPAVLLIPVRSSPLAFPPSRLLALTAALATRLTALQSALQEPLLARMVRILIDLLVLCRATKDRGESAAQHRTEASDRPSDANTWRRSR